MFNNTKLDYATIVIGDKRLVEGHCSYWEMGANGAYIKLVIDGKEYMTGTNNVMLSEDPNR